MAPSNLTIHRLERPDEKFVKDAISVFVSVMQEDVLAGILTGNNLSLLPLQGQAMIGGLVLTPGFAEVYTATDEAGELVGYVICTPPGHLLFSTEETRSHGFYEYADALAPEARDYFLKLMAKLPPDTNPTRDLERASYWCNFAMVRGDYQNKGVGTALFALAFARGEQLRANVALTATRGSNVPIYEKMGFKEVGHKAVASPWGEWELWYMSNERFQE
ncbi:hypothetical protein PHLGIDRAFT_102407 [Phlebiopsis gigantea 11061_1 CR5-6]|uniref:N-acetyltransferase domain-containing protein n=1 Tax=Phlebiopsis gigantea (strain 11061_1 CR5-6) TaxID=745531 RepID=A0A0C3PR69_PHLG1|nr:hypothetical protein PHLGIDRAFT_102407 [Phlebiopsis gigantea 11061_1 CR5-6]